MKNENKYNFFSSVSVALIPLFDDQTKKANIVQNILIAKISFSFGKLLYNYQYFWSHGKSFFFTMCFVKILILTMSILTKYTIKISLLLVVYSRVTVMYEVSTPSHLILWKNHCFQFYEKQHPKKSMLYLEM